MSEFQQANGKKTGGFLSLVHTPPKCNNGCLVCCNMNYVKCMENARSEGIDEGRFEVFLLMGGLGVLRGMIRYLKK